MAFFMASCMPSCTLHLTLPRAIGWKGRGFRAAWALRATPLLGFMAWNAILDVLRARRAAAVEQRGRGAVAVPGWRVVGRWGCARLAELAGTGLRAPALRDYGPRAAFFARDDPLSELRLLQRDYKASPTAARAETPPRTGSPPRWCTHHRPIDPCRCSLRRCRSPALRD
jgi:hypothetical protein